MAPVDRLNVWKGRWADKPGEIVLNRNPTDSTGRGTPTAGQHSHVPAVRTLTVVGFAYSVSGSADAWVTPAQMTSLKPTSTQMLYRFAQAATNAQVSAGQSAVTAGLPSGALLGTQSYLALRALASGEPNTFVPFLMVFGWLGLAVAVLIVANVVSGAVVAGFRHIGVLKALGFTPLQVMTVYLAMVSIPAVVGCAVGVVLGNVLARVLADKGFRELWRGWCRRTGLGGRRGDARRTCAGGAVRTVACVAGAQSFGGRGDQCGQRTAGRAGSAGAAVAERYPAAAVGEPWARAAVRQAGAYGADAGGRRTRCHERDAWRSGSGKSLTTYQTAASRVGAVDLAMFAGAGRLQAPGEDAATRRRS